MSATVILSDVRVQKGFQDKPQLVVTDTTIKDRVQLRFKVSNKSGSNGDGDHWDNYTVEFFTKKDSKLIPILGTPDVRVNVVGSLSLEEYEKNKFMKIRAYNVDLCVRQAPAESKPVEPKASSNSDPF